MSLRKGNKKIRQDSAKERKEDYAKLTVAQKIEILDKKFGKGVGAKKQRDKLMGKRDALKKDTLNEVSEIPKETIKVPINETVKSPQKKSKEKVK